MKYAVRVNKEVKDVHIYKIIKKTSGNVNFLTRLFMKVFAPTRKEETMKI